MKILLITPASSQVLGFRRSLINSLKSDGNDISVITFDDKNKEKVSEMGVSFYCVSDSNRGMNPFKVFSLPHRIAKEVEHIKPDIVMTFMLKPNIYGTLAAAKCGIKKIYCMVEGAGDIFINNGFKWKLIRSYVCHMYKKAFKRAQNIIFLNNDDKSEFIARKLVNPEKCEIVHGIGVNTERFACAPLKNNNVFLMVARMLTTKGVLNYCEAARIVKSKYPTAIFNYLGAEGNIKVADIQPYIDDGSINYLGTTNDVRPYLEDCTCLVLPTYREGFPVSVMEAQSVGRAVIVSDTNGCRDTVKDGYNGFLVEKKNSMAFAEKIIWCIEHPEDVAIMGNNARSFAEKNFDEKVVTAQTVGLIYSDSGATDEQ